MRNFIRPLTGRSVAISMTLVQLVRLRNGFRERAKGRSRHLNFDD